MTTGSSDRPTARSTTRDQHRVNRGELVFPEQHPSDPLEDEDTKIATHRGGLGTARTEFY